MKTFLLDVQKLLRAGIYHLYQWILHICALIVAVLCLWMGWVNWQWQDYCYTSGEKHFIVEPSRTVQIAIDCPVSVATLKDNFGKLYLPDGWEIEHLEEKVRRF